MERSSNGKQREVGASEHLLSSFRTTTLLAHSLRKDRHMPQHELQKIDVTASVTYNRWARGFWKKRGP